MNKDYSNKLQKASSWLSDTVSFRVGASLFMELIGMKLLSLKNNEFKPIWEELVKNPLGNFDEIEEGQILLHPIINSYGQMIMPAGAVVSLKHINILKTWNIKTITIKEEDDVEEEEAGSDFGDEIFKQATQRIEGRLNWIPENEWEQELYNIGLKRACEIIGRSKGN